MTDRENFLERWSRKKREGADAPATPSATERAAPAAAGTDAKPAAPDNAQAGAQVGAQGAKPPVEFDLASLPSLDSISAATDIRAFLAPGVPADLARAALRRAWAADPAIRNFVGLAENDWDFTNPTAVPGFGALAPGTDVKKLLAQIFGAIDQEAAAPTPKSQPNAPPQPQVTGHAKKIPSSASSDEPNAKTEPSGRPVAMRSQPAELMRDNNTAPHNSNSRNQIDEPKTRHQHGGALPE